MAAPALPASPEGLPPDYGEATRPPHTRAAAVSRLLSMDVRHLPGQGLVDRLIHESHRDPFPAQVRTHDDRNQSASSAGAPENQQGGRPCSRRAGGMATKNERNGQIARKLPSCP